MDLNAVVTGMQRIMRRTVSEDIELRTASGHDLHPVEADKGQIEQVILNLVVNARDAMPKGGVITITTANVDVMPGHPLIGSGLSCGQHVMLAVSDTGAGMDEATKVRIFEPFFTTKPAGKGTGLGLATVLGIVKQSGGHVVVESDPGRGAMLSGVYLRRVDGAATGRRESPTPAIRSTGGGETVLLVEDETQVRALMRNVLARAGYEVIDAPDPEAALAASGRARHEIDLLVTDVIMPKMSGRRLAERLVEARPSMKVLYVSGYTEDAIGHHGVLEPGIELLQKPITPDLLLRRVRELLDARKIYSPGTP